MKHRNEGARSFWLTVFACRYAYTKRWILFSYNSKLVGSEIWNKQQNPESASVRYMQYGGGGVDATTTTEQWSVNLETYISTFDYHILSTYIYDSRLPVILSDPQISAPDKSVSPPGYLPVLA